MNVNQPGAVQIGKLIRFFIPFVIIIMMTGCTIGSDSNTENTPREVFDDNLPGNPSAAGSSVSQDTETSVSIGSEEPDQNGYHGSDSIDTQDSSGLDPAPEYEKDGLDDLDKPDDNEPLSVTICMVGDILLHTPVEEASRREDGSYDYSHIFANTTDLISAADMAIVNEEVIIGGEELGVSGYPAFNASYEVCDALADSGFDVVLHATNHALDKGGRGVRNCYSHWEEYYPDIEILGIHDSAEDQDHISVMDVDGIRIAVLNYTYGTNGIPIPQDMPYAVDMLDKERVLSDLARAEEMADFTIVCPHWGTEYRLDPDPSQKEWARIFAENGADLVIGSHPHVIEPVEWEGDTLVYYSLGNFVNWTSGTGPGTANRMVGGMALVTLGKDPDSDRVVIDDYGVTALVTDLHEGTDGVTVYRLEDYSPEMADANEIRRQDPSFTYDYCTDLCDKIWGELWREP